jgi:hypothetical protein
MVDKINEHLTSLKQLLSGEIRPKSIVGSGYVYPKAVASEWLRKEVHNLENPNTKVAEVYVSTSGKAFKSEALAMKSKAYQAILNNTYHAINNVVIRDYGVMPAPGADGYMVYVA